MKIIYECEKVAILQEDDMFLVHVLDNYRLVKEIQTNRMNLLSILKNEIPDLKLSKSDLFVNKKTGSFTKFRNQKSILKHARTSAIGK